MWTFAILVGTVLVLALGVLIFVYASPQFGQKPQGAHLERIQHSSHYGTKGFVNLTETTTGDIWEALKKTPEMFFGKDKEPHSPLPVAFANGIPIDSVVQITWYGHSAFLMEWGMQRILIDPMLGEVASPVPFGTKRFAYNKPIPIENLTDIDLVVISHDHYDHLDYPTIKKIKDQVAQFITPLGVGSHLKAWGVPEDKIMELDWWQRTEVKGIEVTATPARHFSGRGFGDRDATLWAGWVFQEGTHRVFFSGDSGYGPHFKEIGDRLGPFDLAMMECGQYNETWQNIHMMPEETVQAALDVKALQAMPIHWGAFRLAPHSWTDPVERFTKSAKSLGVPYILPEIGERFQLGVDLPVKNWWQEVN